MVDVNLVEMGQGNLKYTLSLPNGWKNKRLRFMAKFSPSTQEITLKNDDKVSFVPMASVGEYGGMDTSVNKLLEDVVKGYTYFANGDVVVAKITPCFENGKGALSGELMNSVGFGSTEFHVIRPNDDLDKLFLFYLSISEPFRKLGEGSMYGAGGQKRVSERFIKDFFAPIPDLGEQRSITTFLEVKTAHIDELIAKKEELLERLVEKRSAIITNAVTKGLNPKAPMKESGINWLGDIPEHWKLCRIKDVTQKVGSGVTPSGGSETYLDEGVIFLRSQNVHFDGLRLRDVAYIDEEVHKSMSRTFVKKGDVLLNITGASIGRCCVFNLDEQANVNQHVCIIRTQGETNEEFVNFFLSSNLGQSQIDMSQNGSSREGLNFVDLKSFYIPHPPKGEQLKIVQSIQQELFELNQLKSKCLEAIERLNEYRSAIITAAVTGKIKVK